MSQEIIQGFVYHIKDSYFKVAQDNMLMRNHEGGAYRPTYLCIQDDKTNLFWAIPMSRQVEKYKKVVDKDIEAYGNCVKILIARYGEAESAFLFQNMFPITEKYIDHIHTIGGNPVQVDSDVKEKVTQIFKENIRLHKRGVKVIFTDINRLEKLMLDEIAECKITIEEQIGHVLTGDAQKNALDFIAFLQANEISLDSNGDNEGWAVGGIVGNSIGFMLVNGAPDCPGPWTMWFNSCDFGDGGNINDDLKETVWAHASPCGKCHAGWENCGGGNRTIFGREFEKLCHSPLMFTNPGGKTLENMKKLILNFKSTNK